MPKTAIDYSKTIIYKFCCNDLEIKDIYVGHTTNFIKRKGQHKDNAVNETIKSEYKLYKTIKANGGWENWTMLQVEEYPCNNKREAEIRERYWIEQLKPNLNRNIPTRTKKDWREANKEQIAEKKKQKYEANKEKIAEIRKQFYEANKEQFAEKGKQYREVNKEQIAEKAKQFREVNKEQIAEKKKQYYEANKEQILAQQKQYRSTKDGSC